MEGFVKLKWYEFSQNNSGGYFNEDENQGPVVWIQAVDVDHAWSKANEMFDFNYCPCCGERWYPPWGDDGTDIPMLDGEPYDNVKKGAWLGYGILHYYDGHKERVDFKPKA